VNELEIECVSCHSIRGVGETIAPDLTEFGAYTEHEFELTHDMRFVEGHHDMYNWTLEHFINPQKVTPGDEETGQEPTIMPDFEFNKEQAHALTVFVFSLKPSIIPGKYQYSEIKALKKQARPEGPTFIREFEESFGEFDELPPGKQLFVASKCWFCHKINGKGGKVGPDLTKVGSRRTKAWLLNHFNTLDERKDHPMSGRFNFTEQQVEDLTDYLSSLK